MPPCQYRIPLFLLALSLFHSTRAALDSDDPLVEQWPVEIPLRFPSLSVQRPVGVVAGTDTLIYIATAAGQLFTANVKTAHVQLINPGGDNQRFGGLCLDSRGPGTLYAPGRTSGILFAFNRRGELLQTYQIVPSSEKGGNSFLSSCIQTRYQLLIVDSYNPKLYYLKLADVGPLRGSPPELEEGFKFQGVERLLEGDWDQVEGFNAYGVEWTAKQQYLAYVFNSASGKLYTCAINQKGVKGDMKEVVVMGKMNVFPGALHILFDSKNENILYLSMPHLNAIAVLEISWIYPRRAKFIRMITSPLANGIIAISEYGEFIYPVNAIFTQSAQSNPTYSLIQLSRHHQVIDGSTENQQFTTIYDGNEQQDLPTVAPISTIQQLLVEAPESVGTSAPVPIGTPPIMPSPETLVTATPLPETTASQTVTITPEPTFASVASSTTSHASPTPHPTTDTGPSSVFALNDFDTDPDDGACFPASATVQMEDGVLKRMDQLTIGARVLVGIDQHGNDLFSDVFLFSHKHKKVISTFIRITTSRQQVLEITEGHYLYANGNLATANTVAIGDVLHDSREGHVRVESVQFVRREGLFNPQTINGDIIVNGIRTSTYTSAVDPLTARALLAPLRALHGFGRSWWTRLEGVFEKGGNGFEMYLPQGKATFT